MCIRDSVGARSRHWNGYYHRQDHLPGTIIIPNSNAYYYYYRQLFGLGR